VAVEGTSFDHHQPFKDDGNKLGDSLDTGDSNRTFIEGL